MFMPGGVDGSFERGGEDISAVVLGKRVRIFRRQCSATGCACLFPSQGGDDLRWHLKARDLDISLAVLSKVDEDISVASLSQGGEDTSLVVVGYVAGQGGEAISSPLWGQRVRIFRR